MKMNTWTGLLLTTTCMLLAGAAGAADVTTFESCVDSRGRTLPAEADQQQAMLVRTVVNEAGQASIRYNPGVLPRLTFNARLFFYMNECARHGLGDSARMVPAARARAADCSALNSMVEGALLLPEDVPSLQAELSFSEAEWQLLPGPMRNFELTRCQVGRSGNVLRLPVDAPPTEKQVGWNNCVRACADKLWHCQKGCRGSACDACLETHRECRAGCGPSDKPAAPAR
jgi:hypothetical protein